MNYRVMATLGAASLVCAGEAQAATIVQTVYEGNGPAYVDPFNTARGTLNSVTVAATVFNVLYFSVSGNDAPDVVVDGRFGTTFSDFVDVSGVYRSFRQDPNLLSVRLVKDIVGVTTSNFSNFTGPTSVVLSAAANPVTALIDGRTLPFAVVSFRGQGGGRFTVTYDYEPAAEVGPVPEPSTWALMLAGFGLVGYAMRRRTRVAFA